jgi:hypothetical protein
VLCRCGQATALLGEMGDKYKQLEASMDENAQVGGHIRGPPQTLAPSSAMTGRSCCMLGSLGLRRMQGNLERNLSVAPNSAAQIFKQVAGESGRHAEVTRRLEAQLAAREREAAALRQDCAAGRARLIEVSAENHVLKSQVRGEISPMRNTPWNKDGMRRSCVGMTTHRWAGFEFDMLLRSKRRRAGSRRSGCARRTARCRSWRARCRRRCAR